MDEANFTLKKLSGRISNFYTQRNEFLENYSDSFALSGGEPTLNPKLIEIIKSINGFFPDIKISCLTNGRKFLSKDFTKRIVQAHKNLEFIIPIHADTARLHDRITMSNGSFFETLRGLRNIFNCKNKSQKVEIRIVLHKLNSCFIDKILSFIKSEFPECDRIVLIFFEIEGQAQKKISILKLKYKELFEFINKIPLDEYLKHRIRFYHFPLCTIPVRFFKFTWRTLPKSDICFLSKCKNCDLAELCLGIPRNYLALFGNSEFEPVKLGDLRIKKTKNWYHPIEKINKII